MKKIDKLILSSFLGPFALTFLVVVFIFLMQHMLKYFDDIIGKDLGWDVLGTLLFYFAVFMTPVALPLAVLLSSLITFGNLGEHFELTAIKSLGVSLTRVLVPIFMTVIMITCIAFLANNYLVPKAALEAYSLLYDIKQKKPSLDLREGAFYGGIPEVNIKVNKKYPDGVTIAGVVIYDHRGRSGNKEVTVADSGRMYTIMNNQYLKLELFRGYNYSEGDANDQNMTGQERSGNTFSKASFDKTFLIFDLSAFVLARTDKKWFQNNRIMRNLTELDADMDSVGTQMAHSTLSSFEGISNMSNPSTKSFNFSLPPDLEAVRQKRDSIQLKGAVENLSRVNFRSKDSVANASKLMHRELMKKKLARLILDTLGRAKVDSLLNLKVNTNEVTTALSTLRMLKSQLLSTTENLEAQLYEFTIFEIQWHKILATSFACMAMFLIGAPLGAIIKKGGLGVPVLISILFFILYYVISLMGEKWAKQNVVSAPVGLWASDVVLVIFGLFFLRQARIDARLFESDFYQVVAEKFRRRFRKEN